MKDITVLFLIDSIKKLYINKKRMIEEQENGIKEYSKELIEISKRYIKTIEITSTYLDDREYEIIYNEIILGKKNDWYLETMSSSTYYRYNKKAYARFIELLSE